VSSPRAVSHLPPPPPPAQLTGFPQHRYPAGSRLFRSHAAVNGPWWYASDGGGRFDLAPPHGTCYLAEDPVITLLETWGGMQTIPSYLADTRAVSTLQLPAAHNLADLTDNRAAGYGVTAEIATTPDYPLTQLWAAALHAVGMTGIRYWARHDLQHTHACLALFGPAGPRPSPPGPHPNPVTDDSDLLRQLRDTTGITVLPVPPATP